MPPWSCHRTMPLLQEAPDSGIIEGGVVMDHPGFLRNRILTWLTVNPPGICPQSTPTRLD